MAQVIAVLNQKGGVGKTTTTINLAAYLAKAGKTVLIVDIDPQGNATSGLGVDKKALETTIYDVLLGQTEPARAILDTDVAQVSLLPANPELAGAETELAGHANREVLLRGAVQDFAYDFVLIDCPPALGLLTVNALVAASWLLIPVQAEYYALEGLSQLIEIFQKVKEGMNPNLNLLGVLITMHDARTTLADQVVKELQQHFGDSVFHTQIPRNVRLAEAPSYGKPISEHDKWSKGARAYKQLAKEVLKRVQN